MAATPQTLSFAGGEWSPTMWNRTDLQKYQVGMRICRNGYPHIEGGWSNRPGTQFINEVKTSSKKTRVVPFEFSVVQAYIIEFGDQYVRFYKDGGRIESPPGTPVEVATPYLEADLALLKFEQSADTLIITHPSYAPRKLTRSSHTSWTLSTITYGATQQPPTSLSTGTAGTSTYALTAISSSGEESVISNTVASTDTATLTWVAASGAVAYNIYKQVSGLYGWCFKVGAVTTYTLTAVTPDMSKSPPTLVSKFTGADAYPGVSAFYQQRLWWGRTNNQPQTLFGSTIGNFYSFNQHSPIEDADGIEATINSTKVNEIKRIIPMSLGAIVGTSGAIFSLSGVNDGAITPTAINIKQQESRFGMNDMKGIVVGNKVIYFDFSSKRCRDLYYEIASYQYQGSELSIWAKHLFKDYKAVEWDYQTYPDSIAWIVREDGTLIGLSYQRESGASDFVAWHRHDTDGYFESVATIPTTSGTTEAWVVVRRTINGSTKRYIERFTQRTFTSIRDAWFVDCGLQYNSPVTVTSITKASPGVVTAASHGFSNGDTVIFTDISGMDEIDSDVLNRYYKVANATTNTFTLKSVVDNSDIDTSSYTAYVSGGYVRKCVTTISGLSHLEGKTLVGLADGNVVSNLTVSSGSVTLPNAAGFVTLGLSYKPEGMPLSYEYNTQTGTVQDKTRQVRSVFVSLRDTRGVAFAPDAETTAIEAKLTKSGQWASPLEIFNGDKEIEVKPSTNIRQGTVYFTVNYPVPCTITRIVARSYEGER